MNVAGITGILVETPELKTTQKGDSVSSFTVAVKRPHSKDKTDFIDCVAWRDKAEFITRHFAKGMKIEISGFYTTRLYESNGGKRKSTELMCEEVQFGERKTDNSPAPYQQSNQTPHMDDFSEVPDGDNLPF